MKWDDPEGGPETHDATGPWFDAPGDMEMSPTSRCFKVTGPLQAAVTPANMANLPEDVSLLFIFFGPQKGKSRWFLLIFNPFQRGC